MTSHTELRRLATTRDRLAAALANNAPDKLTMQDICRLSELFAAAYDMPDTEACNRKGAQRYNEEFDRLSAAVNALGEP